MRAELVNTRPDCDVLVLGGGVNGTGVARDLALRGLSVTLVERNDLAFGASGNSSGMIHGGPRYMLSTPEVTRTSCTDSGYVQAIAPHLIFRIPFLVPVHGSGARGRIMLDLMQGFFRAYDDFQPLKRGKPHVRLTPEHARRIVPGLRVDGMAGAISFDEWGIDGARLCAANALDAAEHGARIFVHTTAEELLFERPDAPRGERGAVIGARVRDLITNAASEIRARITVNATGAWSPITGALAGVEAHVRVRPGKGIHVVLDRRIADVAVAARSIDGRQIFVEPWENTSVVGTTDDDEYGDLDTLCANTAEVRYLLEGIESVLPGVRGARVIGTTAGARPTLYAYGKSEDSLSREHEVVDHSTHGVAGLFSMIGGKLASYRLFAVEASDLVAAALECRAASSTHTSFLPGGENVPDPNTLATRFGVSTYAARRLVDRHGSRAEDILAIAERHPRTRRVVCACEPVLGCEIVYAARVEWARTLDDVSRRTRLGLGPCGGVDCALAAAMLLSETLGWSPAEARAEARGFLRARARSRLSGMAAAQARAESATAAALAKLHEAV